MGNCRAALYLYKAFNYKPAYEPTKVALDLEVEEKGKGGLVGASLNLKSEGLITFLVNFVVG